MFVAWQGPFRITFLCTKNTLRDGITRVGVPRVEHVAFHARKNALLSIQKESS